MLTLGIYFCVKLGLLQLYPAYICYKALKVNNQQEFGSLLTFWVVSISYLAVEYFSDIFLFWIPFYTEIKLVIVLWLILPQTQGASVFYTKYLDPFLHQHEEHIDNALLEIQAKLKETILLYGKQLIGSIKKLISDTVFKGAEHQEQQVTPKSTTETTASSLLSSTPSSSATGGIISPYNLFSTLILSTANRFQQQQQQQQQQQHKEQEQPKEQVQETPSESPILVTESPTTTAAVVEKLDRTDSHDSLQSYVNIKSADDNNNNTSQSSWGGYLASYVWKQPNTTATTDTTGNIQDSKKQD